MRKCNKHVKARNFLAILVLLLAAAMLLTSCGGNSGGAGTDESEDPAADASSETKVVTMGMMNAWTSLYPFAGGGGEPNGVVQSLVFDGLATTSNDGEIHPRLVDGWDVSSDGKTFTFHVVENAKWHDGTPVTAADIEWTYKFFANAETQCDMRPNFRYIVGTNDDGTSVSADSIDVTATDDHTVVIVLKEPTSPETFFSIASSMILPKHLLENEDPSTMSANAFWQNPVGSGPLKFESMVDGERIEYTANKDYHLGAPQMDRFVMRIVPQSSLLAGLMSGDIDILAGGELGLLSMDDYELAMDDANLVTEALGSFSHTYISIDNSNPMMSKDVRLAIDRAIDKQRIVDELLGGFGQVTVTPWAPSHPFFNPALELNNYDPEEAKALLEAAGWDSSVQLTMGISSTDQFAQNVAALIQQDLAAVGLDVKIQQYDLAAQFEAILDGSIELAITGSAASVEPNNPVVNLFDIYGAWCFGRFTDDTYLQYFNEGLKYHETEKRLPIYYELQALMAEEMPYVYLACPDVLFAYNKKLGNVNGFNFTNYIPVWEWTVAQ